MGNPTFNAGIDYFGLESATSDAVKVTSSNENRSKQSTSGPNSFGDAAVVDSWGETAAPSAEYTVVAAITAASFTLGSITAAGNGMANPVVTGSISINTQNGSAPTISVNGQMVQSGATALRTYTMPPVSLSPRHRAQDFLGLCTIKKGSGTLTVASPVTDYGLESVSANFPIEFSLGQPKGVLLTYDLHGGTATCDFTMNWYASGEPTIVLVSSLALTSPSDTNVTPTMSNPVAKSCPEGGYVQYTWQVSFPLLGVEYVAPAGT